MRLPMAWKYTGNKEKDGPPFQPFLTFKGEPFAFDRESFLASCLTSVDIKKAHKVPIDKFPNQRQQRREKQPQKRIEEQKQLDRIPQLKQHEEKKSATMMDFCYRILQDQFPNGGDRTSIVREKHKNRFYVIQNSGGRPCYFGPHHQSNNGFFVMCEEQGQYGARYGCLASACKGQSHFFSCPEMKPFLIGPRCLPPDSLKKENIISERIFHRIDQYYYGKFKEMGIGNGQALTAHEVIEQCKVLQKYWREDNHAVINHFIRRCRSGELFQAEFQWQNSPFGYRQRKVVLVTHAKMHALYSDKFITLCNLTLEKRIKEPRTIVTMEKVSLSDHLSSGKRKDKMTESEKVYFTSLEFYPALSEEDPRVPDENKLNIYRGMDFPHFAKQWFHNLPVHQRPKQKSRFNLLMTISAT